MTRPNYYKATNLAYRLLAKEKLTLPIDLWKFLGKFASLKIISYSNMAKRFSMTYNEFLKIATSEYGYLQRNSSNLSQAYIVYNDKKDKQTIKFTVAHELGHYLLGHTSDNDTTNKEANCFARNVLCPIPVVREFNLITQLDYMNIFGVSKPMALASLGCGRYDYFYISYHLYNVIEKLAIQYISEQNAIELFKEACYA